MKVQSIKVAPATDISRENYCVTNFIVISSNGKVYKAEKRSYFHTYESEDQLCDPAEWWVDEFFVYDEAGKEVKSKWVQRPIRKAIACFNRYSRLSDTFIEGFHRSSRLSDTFIEGFLRMPQF